MHCPACHKGSVKVVDSRPTKIKVGKSAFLSPSIRRRRHCLDCGHTWTTFEINGGSWMGAKGERSVAAAMAQARRRGFIVPDRLRKDYYDLRQNKAMTAWQAAQSLGIMDRNGVVKEEYLPPPASKTTKSTKKKGKV